MARTLLSHALPSAVLLLLAVPLLATAARADCKDDIDKIMKRRMDAVGALNAVAKKGGGKLDPDAACPPLKNLASIEGEAVAYFTKNGEWCNLPPEFVTKMSESRAKTATLATRACGFAAKMKQMQQQQAQQQKEQAPPLPTGPL